MRPHSFLRALGATALVGGLSLTVLPGAHAATPVNGTVSFACSMPDFGPSADFTYDADVTVEGLRDTEGSSPVTLVASLSDLPGVVPAFISMKDQSVTVKVGLDVDGTAVTLEATGKTDVNPSSNGTKEPVVLPSNIQGTVASTAEDLVVTAKSFEFVVAGVGGTCTAGTGAALGTLTPDLGTPPAPNPTPTPTPTPKPSPSPTKPPKSPSGDAKGTPAKGKVTFDCVLSPPFNTKFTYDVTATVAGARAKEGDTTVNLAADFTKMPGLAPVPIVDGKMRVETTGTVGGKAVTFTGSSTVNAAPNETVAVPRMTATVETDATEAEVELKTFHFEFDEMSGLEIFADCTTSKGVLGAMKMAVGEMDPPGGNGNGGGGESGTGGTGGTTTLPKTGGGDAMPVIALWALALGVVGAGLLVWMPTQRRTEG